VYKIENRHRLGTDIAPQKLEFEIGYVGVPGATRMSAIPQSWTNIAGGSAGLKHIGCLQ
jgi:hypothetical protein